MLPDSLPWIGQKLVENAKIKFNTTFWVDKNWLKVPKKVIFASFENLKLTVKQCYQTG